MTLTPTLALRAVQRCAAALAATLMATLPAASQDKFSFTTNWFAQSEHGGFYQAAAGGLYKKEGLDVQIRMGGPQVNVMQLMAAGQTDCVMADVAQTIKGWEQGVAAVTVAAAFQKDPQVLIGHPGALNRLDDLKGKTILISPAGQQTYWPWLRNKLGLNDAQVRPYTFNIQPFIADKNVVQQGYLSSEPWEIEKQAGFKPAVFLLADHGWPPYSTTIVCMEKTIRERPRAVAAFVRASMQGWHDYLKGDPKAANALIRRDNPAMTNERLAVGIRLMNDTGMVLGGDAARLGVGSMTDERMKVIRDLMVQLGQLDPKIDVKRTYTLQFVRDLRVMP